MMMMMMLDFPKLKGEPIPRIWDSWFSMLDQSVVIFWVNDTKPNIMNIKHITIPRMILVWWIILKHSCEKILLSWICSVIYYLAVVWDNIFSQWLRYFCCLHLVEKKDASLEKEDIKIYLGTAVPTRICNFSCHLWAIWYSLLFLLEKLHNTMKSNIKQITNTWS